MSEQDKKAQPAPEVKPDAAAKPEADAAAKVATKEETIGDALDTKPQPEVKEETVPLAALLDMKKANKKLETDMKALREQIEAGATKKEVNADLKALAEKHNVDPDFLQEFAATVRASAKKDVEEELTKELKPLEDERKSQNEKDRATKIDAAFTKHFGKAMEAMPEFEGIVNKEVIKTLSLDPKNASKTFTQLIEESYGHLVKDRKTVDTASTRANKNDSMDVDTDKASRDPEYFKQIMGDPGLKKKYNQELAKRLASHL